MIIYRAITRAKLNEYQEKHHIIPRSLGGSDEDHNLVLLTAREHFICHMLLPKMLEGNAKHKMIHAAIGMKRSSTGKRYFNARLYQTARKQFTEIAKVRYLGKKLSDETKQKMSEARKGMPKSEDHKKNIANALRGMKKEPMKEEVKQKISSKLKGKESPNKGNRFSLTDEQRAKISESNRRRKLSPETRAKIAASLKARNQKSS
jgi:hypothetical protein